jgi:hypothetical protein
MIDFIWMTLTIRTFLLSQHRKEHDPCDESANMRPIGHTALGVIIGKGKGPRE